MMKGTEYRRELGEILARVLALGWLLLASEFSVHIDWVIDWLMNDESVCSAALLVARGIFLFGVVPKRERERKIPF